MGWGRKDREGEGEAGLPPNANQSRLTGNTLRGKNTASFRVHLYLAGNSRFIVAGALEILDKKFL